jgi:hypothetical protein
MLYLECEVRKPAGLRDTDAIAVVTDHAGGREQVQVETTFLVQRGGRHFLPVWGLVQDHDKKLVEVELPQESAAGTNRIWVPAEKVFFQKEEVPA